jgi:hypothetical protein
MAFLPSASHVIPAMYAETARGAMKEKETDNRQD